MEKLDALFCDTCTANSTAATEAEKALYLTEIPQWRMVTENNILKLERAFSFKNFKDALCLTNKIGELAENHQHHPMIILEWGKVTVHWWTHSIKGLHKNDFIMAAKCNLLDKA